MMKLWILSSPRPVLHLVSEAGVLTASLWHLQVKLLPVALASSPSDALNPSPAAVPGKAVDVTHEEHLPGGLSFRSQRGPALLPLGDEDSLILPFK